MKIIVYTITDCAFSKQEKEYLSSHGLAFEEKNLETNREFLTEMLTVGSNFAGTPVTKIEKDDGQIAVLKGFTPAEFDKVLGFEQPPAAVDPVKPVEASQSQPEKAPQTVPQVEVAPVQETAPVAAPEPIAPVVEPSPTPVADPAMTSVLNTLEQQAQVVAPEPVAPAPAAPVAPVAPPASAAPVIPDPQF